MTSGLCYLCQPNGPFFLHEWPHCKGINDVKPLEGVMGGFRCSCECNKPIQTDALTVRDQT